MHGHMNVKLTYVRLKFVSIIIFSNSGPIPQKMQDIFIKNTSQLKWYTEIIAVCADIFTEHIHALCGVKNKVNPLNPELNPICYLLVLLGAHHFLHVSRIRVKLLTFRLLMSYVYGAPILYVSRSHTTTQHSR